MESNKFLLSAVTILGILLLGFSLFLAFRPSETLTGKITNIATPESNINEEGVAPSERAEGVCVNNVCNPSNSRQICAGGRWVNCLNEKVCNFGECVVPISVGPSVKKIVYSGGGGSGGGGESEVVTTSTPVEPETISSFGAVEDISEIKTKENEKATFSIGGVEQSIKAVSISPTSAATLQNGQEATFNIGDERKIDVNNDGTKDYSLRLDSINFILKEARFLVTKI